MGMDKHTKHVVMFTPPAFREGLPYFSFHKSHRFPLSLYSHPFNRSSLFYLLQSLFKNLFIALSLGYLIHSRIFYYIRPSPNHALYSPCHLCRFERRRRHR